MNMKFRSIGFLTASILMLACFSCTSYRYAGHSHRVPPGQAKKAYRQGGSLPPGQAKKIYGAQSARDFAPGHNK